jgi:hypothetical protein
MSIFGPFNAYEDILNTYFLSQAKKEIRDVKLNVATMQGN